MANNGILQRLAVRRRLNVIWRNSTDNVEMGEAAADALRDFDDFYKLTMVTYVEQNGITGYQTDESGTPILDKLLEFFKWMYESGFLEFLLKLFAGMALAKIAADDSQNPFIGLQDTNFIFALGQIQ